MVGRKGEANSFATITVIVIAVLAVAIIAGSSSGKLSSLVGNILPGGKCPDTGKSTSSYVDDLESNLNAGNEELSLSIYKEFNACFKESDEEKVTEAKDKVNEMFYDYYKPQIVNFYKEFDSEQVVENYEIIIKGVEDTELKEHLEKKFFREAFDSYYGLYSFHTISAFGEDGKTPNPDYGSHCIWIKNTYSDVPTGFESNEDKQKYEEIKFAVASCFTMEVNELRLVFGAGTGQIGVQEAFSSSQKVDQVIGLYREVINLEVPILSHNAQTEVDYLSSCTKRQGRCSSYLYEGQALIHGPSSGFECEGDKPLCVIGELSLKELH